MHAHPLLLSPAQTSPWQSLKSGSSESLAPFHAPCLDIMAAGVSATLLCCLREQASLMERMYQAGLYLESIPHHWRPASLCQVHSPCSAISLLRRWLHTAKRWNTWLFASDSTSTLFSMWSMSFLKNAMLSETRPYAGAAG